MRSIDIINSSQGLNIGAPAYYDLQQPDMQDKIRQLADEERPVKLALLAFIRWDKRKNVQNSCQLQKKFSVDAFFSTP